MRHKPILTAALAIITLLLPSMALAGPLPDTGQTGDYTATFGEDSDYLINPPSYTKLDASGNDLPDNATSWAMVRDNVTGLIWENKTDDGSIRDKDSVYTWEQAQSFFISNLNQQHFGGFSDWRLPTIKELAAIANRATYTPAITTNFFYLLTSNYYYTWSSDSYSASEAWCADFHSGPVGYRPKTEGWYVRAVRGPTSTTNQFVDNGDGTVTDKNTGLMWQQTTPGAMTMNGALTYCENLTLSGFGDWRSPNTHELQSIINYSGGNPCIDTTNFPGTAADYYWSSTSDPRTGFGWIVGFSPGGVGSTNKDLAYYVRAVRGGQYRLQGNIVVSVPKQAFVWTGGQQITILWNTAGIAGDVSISLSRDGGKTYETIAASTPNEGSFDWTVTGPASVNCALKIEPINDPTKGTVQSLFTIEPDPNDTDSDGLPDTWEQTNFGNLDQTAGGDADNDGLTNLQEYTVGTNPNAKDSDGDGMEDGWEAAYSLNPLANDTGADPDGDSFTNGREAQDGTDPANAASHYVLPPVTGRIPDTGQTKCYDNTQEIPCPQEGQAFYGQDGNYLINPPQYIKMDDQGRYLADGATSWAMVYDAVTGLIWEVKTEDGSIHDKDNTYTWDNAQSVFIAGLNSANFGGYADWRLPTPKELASIVDWSRINPAINTAWFPNTAAGSYWSSSSPAFNSGSAWSVFFKYVGVGVISNDKSNSCYVRAVRSGQSRPSGNLVINSDGTVTDTSTGLMWQQGNPGQMSWEQALTYCENITLAGHSDWRLPNATELHSIVDYGRWAPAIDTATFPGTWGGFYWSSSSNGGRAWNVDFHAGYHYDMNISNSYSVRLVRSGQSRSLGNLFIITPAQGGLWDIGTQQTIAWDTAIISGDVAISLSRDGGKTYEVISTSTPNDGHFEWTVTGPTSYNCALKIEPLSDPTKATVQSLFTIKGPGELPYAPSVPSPTNQATSVSLSTTLSWTGGDPDASDTVTYDVYFGTEPNPPLVSSAQSALTYSPSPIAYGQTYYWKIVAKDNNGNTTTSPIWSFTTIANPDSDGDGLPDTWEQTNFGKLDQNAAGDPDGDGLTNMQEYMAGANPNSDDSDGDGMPDDWELSHGLNRLVNDAGEDLDGDSFTNGREFQDGTDPGNAVSYCVLPPVTGRLPDTGQTKCYDNTQEIPCPQEGQAFYGQDANYLINPPQYIKMDGQGRYLADSATIWAMVYDVVTGLIWEIKTDDGSIHDKDNTYTWDNAQSVFIAGLNSANFGGHSDWRLPTAKELATIVDRSRTNISINTVLFPNTVSGGCWSSSSSSSHSAWLVNFCNGIVHSVDKMLSYYVRAVRSGQSRSLGHLVINGDGTVTDTSTGLMWQQSDPGQKNWEQALTYCDNLILAGHSDWHLPNAMELHSIVDYSGHYPLIDATAFPGTAAGYYWSSSSDAFNSVIARLVPFYPAFVPNSTKSDSYFVRAVRSGQSRLLGHLVIWAPVQGGFWDIGSQQTITWDTAGITGDVAISLSRDGGKTYETIMSSTPNDGHFEWAATGPSSYNCALKIEPLSDPTKATVQSLFTIKGPGELPYVPSLSLPVDAATDIAIDTDLSWTGGDPDAGDTVTYDVYFGTDPDPPPVASAQSPLSFELSALSYATTYFWKVVAHDNNGNQSTSQIWSFTTLADPDTDNDGLLDSWETTHFGNLDQTAGSDADNDGLTNLQEYTAGTNPNAEDSDADGMKDGWEVSHSLNPLANDAGADPDGDKFTNGREFQDSTDPANPASHYVLPPVTGRIPDTSQTISYTGTFGEDADYLINPPQYIKMDDQGRYLADGAASWAMVYDVVTGLIWENKTDDGSIHDKDNTYTWYDSNPASNGGNAGTPGSGTDTEDFISTLNASDFGGYSDWRLPTIKELASIVERGVINYSGYIPSINTAWFPNTQMDAHWSSSSYANDGSRAWVTGFNYGGDGPHDKYRSRYVRAVRSGQNRPPGSLIVNVDGTVTDTSTGLMWQQANAGTNSWEQALIYCENLTQGGHSDWRLPNITELQSIVDHSHSNPSIDTTVFPGTSAGRFWSSSAYASNADLAWYIEFNDGYVNGYPRSNSYYVRAVRSGQPKVSGKLYITSPLQAGFWSIGQSLPITWDTAGLGGDVAISLSRDGGKTFETIIASTPNDGNFDWTVTGPTSYNCALKIEPLSDPTKATVQSLFTIKGPGELPYTPSAPSPAHQATNVSLSTTLSWTGGDPDAGDIVTYDVYFGTDPSPPLVASAQSDLSFELPALSYATAYYWKVVAFDNFGNQTSSPIWSFGTDAAPSAPGNLQATPAANTWTTDNTIQVTWTAATDNVAVAGYSFLWDTNPATDPDTTIDTVELSALSLGLSDSDSHYFHIRAVDTANNGGPTVHLGPFKIDATAPTVSAAPAGGCYNAAKAVTLTASEPNTRIYYNRYGQDPFTQGYPYSSPVSITDTTVLNFYAIDAVGNVSQVFSQAYTIDLVPPEAPEIDPAENLTAGNNPRPTFKWKAAADAAGYVLQYAKNANFTSPVQVNAGSALTAQPIADLPESGLWYWRVKAMDGCGNSSDWSSYHYNYIVDTLVRKAVIVAGSGNFPGNDLWTTTKICTNFVFNVLWHRGYWKDKIAYLSHQDPAENSDVDGPATNASLANYLGAWAQDADELVVYLNGHGYPGQFRMGESELLDATALDDLLDALQLQRPGMRIIVVVEACHSGSFLPALRATGSQNRVLIASADFDQRAWLVSDGTISFSWFFWSRTDMGDDLHWAFRAAENATGASFNRDQTPVIDANGNGIANEKFDYLAMDGLHIGMDLLSAGDEVVIGAVSPDLCLNGIATGTIYADEITSANSLQRVWATIIRPDFDPGTPDNPVTALPTVELWHIGAGRYQGSYDGFDVPGAYSVTIMASDTQGLVSAPARTLVVKDPVKGDLDHSGAADLADAIVAAKAVSGMPTGRTSPCEDVNGDGKAGMAELLHALQKAAGIR